MGRSEMEHVESSRNGVVELNEELLDSANVRQGASPMDYWQEASMPARIPEGRQLHRGTAAAGILAAAQFLGGFGFTESSAQGQTNETVPRVVDPGTSPQPAQDKNVYHRPRNLPALVSVAAFEFGEKRTVFVQRSAGTETPNIYQIEPLFAWFERSTPLADAPSIVLKSRQEEGTVHLQMRALLDAPGLNAPEERGGDKVGRDLILRFDKEYATRGSVIPEDKVHAIRWSLLHATVLFVDSMTNEVVAVGSTQSLRNARYADVSVRTTTEGAKRLSMLHERGELNAIWKMSDANEDLGVAQLIQNASQELTQSALSELTSEQRDGAAPISQAMQDRILRNLTTKIDSRMYLSSERVSPYLLPFIKGDFASQFFQSGQYVDIKSLSEVEQRVVAEYLVPRLRTLLESSGTEHIHTDTKENEQGSVTRKSAGGSILVPVGTTGALAGGRAGVSQEDYEREIRRIEDQTGTRYIKTEGKEEWRPHQILGAKLNRTAFNTKVAHAAEVIVALGPNFDRLITSPIPTSFTERVVVDRLAGAAVEIDRQATIDELKKDLAAVTKERDAVREALKSTKATLTKQLNDEKAAHARDNAANAHEIEKWKKRVESRNGH